MELSTLWWCNYKKSRFQACYWCNNGGATIHLTISLWLKHWFVFVTYLRLVIIGHVFQWYSLSTFSKILYWKQDITLWVQFDKFSILFVYNRFKSPDASCGLSSKPEPEVLAVTRASIMSWWGSFGRGQFGRASSWTRTILNERDVRYDWIHERAVGR